MPNQQKPPSPVAESYRPPAGIRHPVASGETSICLARRAGLDPWDLIDFNFPGVKLVKQRDFQLATRYVNWYLAEYRGMPGDVARRPKLCLFLRGRRRKRRVARRSRLSAAWHSPAPTGFGNPFGAFRR